VSRWAPASQSAKHEAEELRRVNLSLVEAIVAAEEEEGGKATRAEFQFKRGFPGFFAALFHRTIDQMRDATGG
jgi:hypothetical protein